MDAKNLVLCFDALLDDNADKMRDIIRDYPLMAKPSLNSVEISELYPQFVDCYYINHFYMHDDKFGIIIEDTPEARKAVEDCNLMDEDYIYWGAQSAPVAICTAAQVAQMMKSYACYPTPKNVIALFETC